MKTQMKRDEQMPGDTHHLVSELVEVLRDELAAHHRLLQLELAKREAILARDGEKLKSSASEQARELYRIDLLESRREKLAERILPGQSMVNLSLIIQSNAVTEPEKQELSRYQIALQAALHELRKLSEVNALMLSDSRDLFKSMIMSLAGKGADRRHATSRPVLVDANC
jgi:hypothetical protein